MFLQKPSAYRQDRGSILIISLWSLCLLSTFAVILGYGVRQKATLVKRLDERERLRLIAEAGVRQALVYLDNIEKSYYALDEPWANGAAYKDMAIGEGRCNIGYEYSDPQSGDTLVRYGLIDEERKLNINKASAKSLEHIFVLTSGLDESSAADLAACILDWRDSDSELSIPSSAEDPYYKRQSFPYPASNSDFQVLEELLFVKGMDEEIFARSRDYLTVYGSGLVNANTAEKQVLMSLGLDDYTANSIIVFRQGDDGMPGTADDGIFESTFDIAPKLSAFCQLSSSQMEQLNTIAQQNLTTMSGSFMIKCTANLTGRKNQSRLVCVASKVGKVLYWRQI